MGIEREKIDVNTIHGFIVDFDDEWVLLQRVFDFYVDGWVFLRRGDISVIQSKPTEVFRRHGWKRRALWSEWTLPVGYLGEESSQCFVVLRAIKW